MSILYGKAEEAGRDVIAVDPRHTSRTCSEIGACRLGQPCQPGGVPMSVVWPQGPTPTSTPPATSFGLDWPLRPLRRPEKKLALQLPEKSRLYPLSVRACDVARPRPSDPRQAPLAPVGRRPDRRCCHRAFLAVATSYLDPIGKRITSPPSPWRGHMPLDPDAAKLLDLLAQQNAPPIETLSPDEARSSAAAAAALSADPGAEVASVAEREIGGVPAWSSRRSARVGPAHILRPSWSGSTAAAG